MTTENKLGNLRDFVLPHFGVTQSAYERYAGLSNAGELPINPEKVESPVAQSIKVVKTETGTDAYLYGVIVPSNQAEVLRMFGETVVSDLEFADLLERQTGTVNLRINSPGGAVWALSSMLVSISNYRQIEGNRIDTTIDGIAASAASVLALTGDNISMAELGEFMIHRSNSGVVGNALDMEKRAASMKRLDETVARIYAEKTGKPMAEVLDLMTEETWFTSATALEAKLIDTVIPAIRKKGKDGDPKDSVEVDPVHMLGDWAKLQDYS